MGSILTQISQSHQIHHQNRCPLYQHWVKFVHHAIYLKVWLRFCVIKKLYLQFLQHPSSHMLFFLYLHKQTTNWQLQTINRYWLTVLTTTVDASLWPFFWLTQMECNMTLFPTLISDFWGKCIAIYYSSFVITKNNQIWQIGRIWPDSAVNVMIILQAILLVQLHSSHWRKAKDIGLTLTVTCICVTFRNWSWWTGRQLKLWGECATSHRAQRSVVQRCDEITVAILF